MAIVAFVVGRFHKGAGADEIYSKRYPKSVVGAGHPLQSVLTSEGRPAHRSDARNVDKMTQEKIIKIVVEKHPDGFIAYPLGINGVVVGEGDTFEEALTDVTSAIHTHLELFGTETIEDELPVLEAFVAEIVVTI